MNDKATLLALAERVEGLDGPDERLDREVAAATAWEHRSGHDWGKVLLWERPRFTASLDAALTLVPEGWEWSLEAEEAEMVWPTPSPWTYRCQMGHLIDREAATPALALCAAALRARAEILP